MGEQRSERGGVTESVLYALLLFAHAPLSPVVMEVCKATTPGFITFP